MIPTEVRAARMAHRSASGDLYGAIGLEKIIDRTQEAPAIAAQCVEMGILPTHLPDFVTQCGYDWITEPDSYDTAVEVAFQRRALLMLAKLWVETTAKSALIPSMSDIVVVQEFATRFGHCSPKIERKRLGSSRRVLSIPASFVDLSIWVFSGLRCWASHALDVSSDTTGDGAWSLVCTPIAARIAQPFNHVVALELIARTLAEAGRDLQLLGDNASLLIREQVPELTGPTGELDPTSLFDFEQNASYMVVEFALAHELGHALLPPTQLSADDQADEMAAHRVGCALLRLSAGTRVFGWGADILPDVTQAAVGIILFRILLDARRVLSDCLLRRASIVPGDRYQSLQYDEKLRAEAARDVCEEMRSAVSASGHHDDASRLSALAANGDAFLRDLDCTLLALPDAAISKALAIAARTAD